jgi:hypothetical protein
MPVGPSNLESGIASFQNKNRNRVAVVMQRRENREDVDR